MLSAPESLEKLEPDPDYIVILIDKTDFVDLGLSSIGESQWTQSLKKGWSLRVDPENPQLGTQRHVHVARTKHISSKNQQVSWNQDRTRHDKKTFNTNLSGFNTARKIATDALGLNNGVVLEALPLTRALKLSLLYESTDNVSNSSPFKPVYFSLKMSN